MKYLSSIGVHRLPISSAGLQSILSLEFSIKMQPYLFQMRLPVVLQIYEKFNLELILLKNQLEYELNESRIVNKN